VRFFFYLFLFTFPSLSSDITQAMDAYEKLLAAHSKESALWDEGISEYSILFFLIVWLGVFLFGLV
jgi:hypothetical protein